MAPSAMPAPADESALRLKDGQGRQLVEAHCVMCHSLDYIPVNRPVLVRKGWEASENKMIRVMGVPVAEQDAKSIVEDLVAHYGR